MQLYFDSFSAFLSVKDGQFQIRLSSSEKRLFSVLTVSAILLTKGTALSIDAALLAMDGDIPVILIDAQTQYPLGQIKVAAPALLPLFEKTSWASAGLAKACNGLQNRLPPKLKGNGCCWWNGAKRGRRSGMMWRAFRE